MIITKNYTVQPSRRYASLATNRLVLDVDSSDSEPITITLPSIASLQNFNAQRIEIVVNDYSNNATTKNIVIQVPELEVANSIQGRTNYTISASGVSAILSVTSDTNWIVDAN